MLHLRSLLRRHLGSILGPCSALVLAAPLAGCGEVASRGDESPDDAALPELVFPDARAPSQDSGHGGSAERDASSANDANTTSGDATSPSLLPILGLTAIPLSVCVPSEYTAAVTIGGSETFQMALDTGSTTLGVASTMCPTCAVTPEYTPGAMATDEHQTGTSQYGTGSWSGEIYEDAVGLGSHAIAPVDFVAIDTQSQFFEPTMCDSASGSMQGIIGFGPASSALPGTNAFFDQLITARGVKNVFATELCDTNGTLWLGGYDPAFTTAPPQYTPLATSFISQYYYAVNLASVTVAGVSVPIGTPEYPDSVVDTGTSIFILPTAAFNAITAAIGNTPAFQSIFGTGTPATDAGSIGDAGDAGDAGNASTAAGAAATAWFSSSQNCSVLSGETKAELDAKLPPLTLVFGSNPSISVQALATESYLMAYQNYWCPALYATDPGPDFPLASIMGSPVLRSNVVIFDRANQRVGFAPHTPCAN